MTISVSNGAENGAEGLPNKHKDVKKVPITAPGTTFSDISGHPNQPAIEAMAARGIINGKGNGLFDPNGTITRQEAAVMVARAAKLCGMETVLDNVSIRDTLAQFGDYVTAAQWAQEGLAFCYREGILDPSNLDIRPTVAILRCEIAQMLWHLLDQAKLL